MHHKALFSFHRKMAEKENDNFYCGVPEWFGIPENDTASYVNDALVATVNLICCVFAVLSNLAIIVTIFKTRSLQRPCNILLCSLAATDCLTSLTAQPIFITLRLTIHSGSSSCGSQDDLFTAFYVSIMLTSGWSFAIITVISFDRYFALSRPLVYRYSVTNRGNTKQRKFPWALSFLHPSLPSPLRPPSLLPGVDPRFYMLPQENVKFNALSLSHSDTTQGTSGVIRKK